MASRIHVPVSQGTRTRSALGRVLRRVATIAALACASPGALAADPPPLATEVKSLIWVGNSFFYYNNGIHGVVGRLLAERGGSGHRSTLVGIGGSGLNWHDVRSYLGPGGLASYSFVGDNEIRFNDTRARKFDAMLMMDCSQCPIHPQLGPLFHEFAARHSEAARSFGTHPALFMSWAYDDKPEMTGQLAAEYVKAGKANDALVVPAGLAFAASKASRPDIALTVADKRHPTVAGTYLAACTVAASLYKVNPVGSAFTAGLPADIAAHLQSVAWETAQAFHAREGRASLP
jgi:hypothetical protein